MPFGDSGGFFLSLVTESFAVRALLGSLAAAGLAGVAVAFDLVRSRRARRLVVLAPVVAAATAAVASMGEAYLPQLWVASGSAGAAGQLVDLLGDLRVVATGSGIDVLVAAYAFVVAVLLARRVAGFVAIRRMLHRARPPVGSGAAVATVQRLAGSMDVRAPRLVLLAGCPGGAFTTGVWRPVVAVDPELLQHLDEGELEGLLAHELAHIARHDTLLGMVVGVFRDLVFFLPALHVAARWLGREQEESADELASAHTNRPVALASSILKVWDAARVPQQPRMACAVTPAAHMRGRLAVAVAGGGATDTQPSGAVRAITSRVERLIERGPAVSRGRSRVEVAAVAAVTTVATSAALVLPGWIASGYDAYSLSFGYLPPPSEPSEESPAFATFRHLTPERSAAGVSADRAAAGVAAAGTAAATVPTEEASAAAPGSGGVGAGSATGCPCVETQAQLRAEVPAVAADSPRMVWGSSGREAWEVSHLAEDHDVYPARPLWTLSDSGPHVGFFLVGRAASERW